nr:hypothetical protein [Caulobacter hibisci]
MHVFYGVAAALADVAGRAEQLQVSWGVLAATGEGHDVVEVKAALDAYPADRTPPGLHFAKALHGASRKFAVLAP